MRARDDSGLTLIELLVVVVILGFLAAIAIPTYLRVRGRAQDVAVHAELRSALHAEWEYHLVNGRYTGDVVALSVIHPEVDWTSTASRDTPMTGAADQGRVYVEINGGQHLIMGERSPSGRCFYLVDRRSGTSPGTFYAVSARCGDPFGYRSATTESW